MLPYEHRFFCLQQSFRTAKSLIAKFLYGEEFSRRSVLSAKYPYGEISEQRSVCTAKCTTAKIPTSKSPTTISPGTNIDIYKIKQIYAEQLSSECARKKNHSDSLAL